MMKLKLRNSPLYATIDIEDYARLKHFRWEYSRARGNYIRAYISHGKYIHLNRAVMNYDGPLVVDHINGNTLDNRKLNLRLATKQENSFNTQKQSLTSSNYKGVSWHIGRNKWYAYIQLDGKTRNLGSFTNEWQAAVAYNKAATKYFGEFAKLNQELKAN